MRSMEEELPRRAAEKSGGQRPQADQKAKPRRLGRRHSLDRAQNARRRPVDVYGMNFPEVVFRQDRIDQHADPPTSASQFVAQVFQLGEYDSPLTKQSPLSTRAAPTSSPRPPEGTGPRARTPRRPRAWRTRPSPPDADP